MNWLLICCCFSLSFNPGHFQTAQSLFTPSIIFPLSVTASYFLEHLLRKKWKNLRDTLIKCLKKRTMIARSGLSGHSKLPNCKFFKELSFLCEILPFPAVTQDLGKPLFSAKHVTPANTVNSANLVSICPPVHTSAQVILKNPCVTSSKVLKRLAPLPTISVYSSPSDVSAKKAFTGYDETPDALFCRSLIPTLKNLSPRSNRLAKMEIQKIMFKYEFGEECSTWVVSCVLNSRLRKICMVTCIC